MRVLVVMCLVVAAGCLEPTSDDPGLHTDPVSGTPTTPATTVAVTPTPTPSPPPSPSGPRAIAFRALGEGQQGGPEAPERGAYDTAPEWAVASQRYPDVDAAIDFTRETVVAVALGQRPDGCWAVRVTNATQRADASVLVEVTTYEPPPDMMCAQVVTYPYHVVALDGSYPDVTFEERNATYGVGSA